MYVSVTTYLILVHSHTYLNLIRCHSGLCLYLDNLLYGWKGRERSHRVKSLTIWMARDNWYRNKRSARFMSVIFYSQRYTHSTVGWMETVKPVTFRITYSDRAPRRTGRRRNARLDMCIYVVRGTRLRLCSTYVMGGGKSRRRWHLYRHPNYFQCYYWNYFGLYHLYSGGCAKGIQ